MLVLGGVRFQDKVLVNVTTQQRRKDLPVWLLSEAEQVANVPERTWYGREIGG